MGGSRSALATMRVVAAAGQGEYSLAEVLERACRAISDGYGFERVAISRLLTTPDGHRALILATAGRAEELPGTRMAVTGGSLLRRAWEAGGLVDSSDPRRGKAATRHRRTRQPRLTLRAPAAE